MSGFTSFPQTLAREPSDEKLRIRPARFADHYSHARMFFRSQAPIEQAHMVSALVFELSKVTLPHVRSRVLANLRNVDEGLANRTAAGLGVSLPAASTAASRPFDARPSKALSLVRNMKNTLEGRSIAILFSDGSDGAAIQRLQRAIKAAGATPVLVSDRIEGVRTTTGRLPAQGQLAGSPSVLFDAVALVLTTEAARRLAGDAAAVQFTMDAFGHLKAIGHTPGALPLLQKAGVKPDAGVTGLDKSFIAAAALRHFDREPGVRPLP